MPKHSKYSMNSIMTVVNHWNNWKLELLSAF